MSPLRRAPRMPRHKGRGSRCVSIRRGTTPPLIRGICRLQPSFDQVARRDLKVAARLQYHARGPAAQVTTVRLVDIDSLIEGQNVDDHYRPWRPFGEDITVKPECRCCAIAQSVAGRARGVDGYEAVDIDRDAVVVRGPDFAGFLVVPRQHVSGLDKLPVPPRAHVLAALQRATRLVLERNRGLETRVVVMTGHPGSEDHACYNVLPCGSDAPVFSVSTSA